MPKNKIDDLRNLMMETIERLLDPEDKIDAKTAIAISQVGNVIVNSVKVEMQAAKMFNKPKPQFFQTSSQTEPLQISNGESLEIPDCPCGSVIFPSAFEKSNALGLNYPRCGDCLVLLPSTAKDLNGGGK